MNRPHVVARIALATTALALSALAPVALHAHAYPSRPVKVVVPFSAVGAVDRPMGIAAQVPGKRWGRQVVVDSKPGAGATIGSDIGDKTVAKAD